jgi:long-chain fatty acid transport protein
MRRRSPGAIVVAAILAWSSTARAVSPPTVYDNYQMVPIGSRAAGMGGAYTALACDEGALHYNPASLSCSDSSHLELSANAYVLQGMLVHGALGPGEDMSAVTYHSIPSIVGAVRVLSEGSARSDVATYPKRFTFGFTVSIPATLALKIDPARADERNHLSFAIRDDLTAGDLGFGYQINREVSVGLALGAVLRSAEQHASWLLVRSSSTPCAAGSCSDYLAFDDDRESYAVGARAKLGVLVRPVRHFSFGLALTTPTINIYGRAKESANLARADGMGYAAVPVRADGKSEVGLPLRIAFGTAYVRRRYTFSADISVNFPQHARVFYDATAQTIGGLGAPPTIPDAVIERTFQPNINLGAGIPFGPERELDIGLFSDLSSVSPADSARTGTDRVHMFGGSMALGLLGKESRAWFGFSGEIGSTTTRVPGRGFNYETVSALPRGALPDDGEATLVRWTLSGVLGSNYAFLE